MDFKHCIAPMYLACCGLPQFEMRHCTTGGTKVFILWKFILMGTCEILLHYFYSHSSCPDLLFQHFWQWSSRHWGSMGLFGLLDWYDSAGVLSMHCKARCCWTSLLCFEGRSRRLQDNHPAWGWIVASSWLLQFYSLHYWLHFHVIFSLTVVWTFNGNLLVVWG